MSLKHLLSHFSRFFIFHHNLFRSWIVVFCIFLTWNTLTRSRFFNHVQYMHKRFFCRVKFKPADAPKFLESNLDLNEPSSFVSMHESSTTAFVTPIKLFLNYFVEETGQLIGSAWPWHQGFGIVAVLKSEFDKDKTEYTWRSEIRTSLDLPMVWILNGSFSLDCFLYKQNLIYK